MHSFNRNLYNVFALGVVFLLIFTAFQTTSILQVTALKNAFNSSQNSSPSMIHLEQNLGYYTLCIIYGMLAISNWLAPSIIVLLGNRLTMIISASLYTIYIATIIYPIVWTILIASFFIGLGAGTLWTAQGAYLCENSNENTSGRNSGIFWALLQASLFIGNIFVYLFLLFSSDGNNEAYTLSTTQNRVIFAVLTVFCALGTLSVLTLTKPVSNKDYVIVVNRFGRDSVHDVEANEKPMRNDVLLQMGLAFVRAIKLLCTKEIMFFCLLFAYTGLELNFFSGVYGSCIGNVKLDSFGVRYVGLNGAFIGIGEVLGGLSFMIIGHYFKGKARAFIVLFGYIVHMVTFYMIYLNLPNRSPSTDINIPHSELQKGAIGLHSNIYVALFDSFLLGLGDSCFNTQIYAFITSVYVGDTSAPAIAIYKFFQSISAMIAFFYNPLLNLNWQLLILVVSGTIGTLGYMVTEFFESRRKKVTNTQRGADSDDPNFSSIKQSDLADSD
ncbi:UNC93-like protein MFSD11-like [Oopsacas minuta]|uniref:UNC93-like protein MFSD11 n=1 Tax=Oopsacas minuta TaxID=111878 RepID=A0AAV7K1X0_9METZ|nr:UNC93-like protein MFSD11-like [Oopsacas minuta]